MLKNSAEWDEGSNSPIVTIVDKDMRTKPNDHITQYSEDVLIGKADLEDKISATVELTTRVEELKMANEYSNS